MIKHIKVTWEHIEAGVPADHNTCPIALAIGEIGINRQFGVYQWSVNFWGSCLAATEYASLPQIATDFIMEYDQGEPVQPFKFDLDIPDSVLPEAR